MKTVKLFIYSILISIVSVLIYHFVFDDMFDLDLISHSSGGVATAIVCVFISNKIKTYSLLDSIILLIFSVFAFEFLENLVFLNVLTDVYPNYPEFIKTPQYYSDTGGDIIFGMLGGISYIIWKWRNGTNIR